MSTRDDGGPAFPRPMSSLAECGDLSGDQDGMSLRDWFAGQALSGYLAAPVNLPTKAHRNQLALACYHIADAMIAARAAAALRAPAPSGDAEARAWLREYRNRDGEWPIDKPARKEGV